MKIEVANKKIAQIKANCEVVFVLKNKLNHKWVTDKSDLAFFNFKADAEQVVFLSDKRKLYIGVETFDSDALRSACALALRTLKSTKCSILKIGLYTSGEKAMSIQAMVEGFLLGNYEFLKYKSKPDQKNLVAKVIMANEDYADDKIENKIVSQSVKQGTEVALAVNYTRNLINQTPDDITPDKIGQIAKNLAKQLNISAQVYDEKFLLKHGMQAFYAVSRGSIHKPRLIHLIYKPKRALAKVAFVGKGLTYDSGGLSLKPSEAMVTMKSDKSGAATVLGIMMAAVKMNIPVEIHGVIGAAENMIGPNAYKPDDVLVSKCGKTIEIRNTDAEGRLVLADCLSYSQDIEPDYIIDIATLTGACVAALGEYTIGVMGHSQELKNKIIKAGEDSGELAAQLPFNKHLAKMIKSQIADIKNVTGSKYGGAITAALFLSEFIDKKYKDKWIHLDIAGPAYHEKEWDYNPYGASGAGVRLGIKFLQQL